MIFVRFKAIVIAGLTLLAAALTTPAPGNAAPVSSGWTAPAQAGEGINSGLVNQIGYHRGYGRHRGYRRAYGHRRVYRGPRHYRPARYYRPVRYARPVYYRPVRYARPVRCRVVYQQVWTGYGYAERPMRVCRRW